MSIRSMDRFGLSTLESRKKLLPLCIHSIRFISFDKLSGDGAAQGLTTPQLSLYQTDEGRVIAASHVCFSCMMFQLYCVVTVQHFKFLTVEMFWLQIVKLDVDSRRGVY